MRIHIICVPWRMRLLHMCASLDRSQQVRWIGSRMCAHQLMQEPMKKRAAAYLLKLAPAAFIGISCMHA